MRFDNGMNPYQQDYPIVGHPFQQRMGPYQVQGMPQGYGMPQPVVAQHPFQNPMQIGYEQHQPMQPQPMIPQHLARLVRPMGY